MKEKGKRFLCALAMAFLVGIGLVGCGGGGGGGSSAGGPTGSGTLAGSAK